MCSGCSGDYAGGYDGQNDDEHEAGTGSTHADSDDGGSAFSRSPGRRPPSNEPQNRTAPEDAYEILVSADRIVEIRIVRENSSSFNKIEASRKPNRPRSSTPEALQFQHLAAKHYQTPVSHNFVSSGLTPARLMRLIIWSLAIYTAGALGIWVALR